MYNCWLASLANWSASQALVMHKWKTCNKVWICHFVVYYSSFSFSFQFLSHLWFLKSWRVVGEGVLSFPSLDGCVFKDTVRTASWSYACACMSVFLWIEMCRKRLINICNIYSVHNFSNLLIRIQGLLAVFLQNWKRELKKEKETFIFC